ncbi:MAG: hypothetical protein JWL59_4322 [Chthoniobacteraceae bacterium]|nr:hypothetical protein [Chthoniobacteraceae bacterium]
MKIRRAIERSCTKHETATVEVESLDKALDELNEFAEQAQLLMFYEKDYTNYGITVTARSSEDEGTDKFKFRLLIQERAEWTKQQALQWVMKHDEDDVLHADMERAFRAIFEREPNGDEVAKGLWEALSIAAVE